MIPSGYEFRYQQLNPITWRVFVKTPDNVVLSSNIQYQMQPPDNIIYSALMDKNQRNNWTIEIDAAVNKT